MYRYVLGCSESNNTAVSIDQNWFNAEKVDELHSMYFDHSFCRSVCGSWSTRHLSESSSSLRYLDIVNIVIEPLRHLFWI